MTAAAITAYEFMLYGSSVKRASILKVTQSDWTVLDAPGIVLLRATLVTGAAETATYETLTVNNKSTAYSATSTTIAYDGATALARDSGGFYVLSTSGEILYVLADSGYSSTSGNLTVRRGCLGTTASLTGLADDNTLYVLNSVLLGSATTGPVEIAYIPLPNDPGVDMIQ